MVGAVGQQFAQQDGRRRPGVRVQVLRREGQRAEDDAVHEVRTETGQCRLLLLAVRAGLVDQHGQGAPLGLPDDMAGQFREIRDVEFGHYQGDDARPSAAQVPSGEVDAVTEVVDRLLHHPPGPVGHMDVVVEHVGHRFLRHPRMPCDVLDPRPCHPQPPRPRYAPSLCGSLPRAPDGSGAADAGE